MAYTPDLEAIADALKRVMATGTTEDEAKTDLCRALADRKIDIRVRIAASGYGRQRQVFSDGNVGVPPHLSPNDVDWTQSRPLGPWLIGPKLGEHYSWNWENRPLDLIEVSTADVIAVLCGTAGHRSDNEPAVRATKEQRRDKSRPQLERARNAIRRLYPEGVPGQAEEPNKTLCRRVGDKLKQTNLPTVSDDTILRAAGRRK